MTKLALFLFAASAASRTFTGVITDSMCLGNHKAMHIAPDSKCIVECVKSSRTVKYVLYDGKTVYQLSDQQTPARFAGQKVTITGALAGTTIQVTKIE